jgi:hypothetical protein
MTDAMPKTGSNARAIDLPEPFADGIPVKRKTTRKRSRMLRKEIQKEVRSSASSETGGGKRLQDRWLIG